MADREGFVADPAAAGTYRNASTGCSIAFIEPTPLPDSSLAVEGDEEASFDLLAALKGRDATDVSATAQTSQLGSREEPGYFFDAAFIYTVESESLHVITAARAFQDAGLGVAVMVLCQDETSVRDAATVAWGAVRFDEG